MVVAKSHRRLVGMVLASAVFWGGVLVLVVGSGRTAQGPVSLVRVTRAAEARFGSSYDWACERENVSQRTVICRTQPNGTYEARYYVQPDGTPVLETYNAPSP